MGVLRPDWHVQGVAGFVTTRAFGDAVLAAKKLEALVPRPPFWLHQVHGRRVVDADVETGVPQADAAVARRPGTVCVVKAADCMPVLLADERASVVGIAHAGWRGLAAGVLEATVDAMRVEARHVVAWLGPAIGPEVYEVGEDVRAALADLPQAFRPNRPGHWLLDLYAVARAKLQARGVARIYGGGFCTYRDERFFSYRRDGTSGRMAALLWIA